MKFRFFFKYLVAMLLVAGSVASCYDGMTSDVSISSVRHGRKFVTSMTFAPMDNIPETKSQYTGSETVVNDWNLFVFDATGTRVGAYYKADNGDIEFSVLLGQEYTYFALANVGNLTASTSDAMHMVDISSFRAMTLDVTGYSGGLPMAWTGTRTFTREEYDNNNRSLSLDVRMKRLVGKFNIVYDPSNLSKWSYAVKTLNLYGVSTVKPFVEGSTGSSNATVNDSATAADIVALNGGQPVKFFPVENVVPTPSNLQSNTDPWRKVPGEVGNKYPSYIEITGEATMTDGSALKKDVTFRFYLGKDNVKNFEVVRNEENTITFQPTDDSIEEDPTVNWKVEPEPITDTRSIRFQRNINEATSATNPFLLRSGLTSDEAVVRLVDNVASDFKYNVEVQGGTPADWLTVDNATGQPVSSLSAVTMSSLHLSAKAGTDAEGWVLISTLDGKKTDKLYVKVFNATIDVKPDDPLTWDWNEHTQKDVTVTCTVPWTVTVPSGWSLTYATGGAVTGEQPACSNLALKILPPTADYMDIAEDGTSTLSFSASGTEGDAVTLIRRYKPQVTSSGSSEATMTWEWNQSGTGSGKTLTLSSNEDWVVVWPEGDHSHWNVSPASGAKTATSISVYPVENNENVDPIIGTFYVVPVRDGHNVDEGRLTVTLTHGLGKYLVGLRFGLWPNATTERFHSDTTVTYQYSSSNYEKIWPHVYADYSDGTVEMIAEADLDNGFVYDATLLGRPSDGYFYGKKACETTITASFTDKGITKNATANITVLHGAVRGFKIEPTSAEILAGGHTQSFTPYALYYGDDTWLELSAEEKQNVQWMIPDPEYSEAHYDIFTVDNDGVVTSLDKRGVRTLRARWNSTYASASIEVYSLLVSLEYRPDVIDFRTAGIDAAAPTGWSGNSMRRNALPITLVATYQDGTEDDFSNLDVYEYFASADQLTFTSYLAYYSNSAENNTYAVKSASRNIFGYSFQNNGFSVYAAKNDDYYTSPSFVDDDGEERNFIEGFWLRETPQVFHESSFTYRGVTKTASLNAMVSREIQLVIGGPLWFLANEKGSGTVKNISVTVDAGIAWTASLSSDSDFYIVSGTESGVGSGNISIVCRDDNNTGAQRHADLTVSVTGKSASTTVNQHYRVEYSGLQASVSPEEIEVGDTGQGSVTYVHAVSYDSGATYPERTETVPTNVSWSVVDGYSSYVSVNSSGLVNAIAAHEKAGMVQATAEGHTAVAEFAVIGGGGGGGDRTFVDLVSVTVYDSNGNVAGDVTLPFGGNESYTVYGTFNIYRGTSRPSAVLVEEGVVDEISSGKFTWNWSGDTEYATANVVRNTNNTGSSKAVTFDDLSVRSGTSTYVSGTTYSGNCNLASGTLTPTNSGFVVTLESGSGNIYTAAYIVVSVDDPEISVGGTTTASATKYVGTCTTTSSTAPTSKSDYDWNNGTPLTSGFVSDDTDIASVSGTTVTGVAAGSVTISNITSLSSYDQVFDQITASVTVTPSVEPTFVRHEYGNLAVSASVNTNPIAASSTGAQLGYTVSCTRWDYFSDGSYRNETPIENASGYVNVSYSKKSGSNEWFVDPSSGDISVSKNTSTSSRSAEFTVTCSIKNTYTVKSGEDRSKSDDVTVNQSGAEAPVDPELDYIAFVHNNTEVDEARLDYSNSWLYDCQVWAFYTNDTHVDITNDNTLTISCPNGFFYTNRQFSTDRETSGSATASWKGKVATIDLTSVDALILGGINPSFEDYTGTPSQPAQPGSWGVTTRVQMTAYFLHALREGGENRDITGTVSYTGDISNTKLQISQNSSWISITPYQYASSGTEWSVTFSYEDEYGNVATITLTFKRTSSGGTNISVEE